MFREALCSLNKAKYDAELALEINKIGKLPNYKHKHHHTVRSLHEEEDKVDKEESDKKSKEKQRLDAECLEDIGKKAERDKTWFMSHPHRFLRPRENPKGVPFCFVCKQKAHEYWLKQMNEGESTRKQGSLKLLDQVVEDAEENLYAEVESEHCQELKAAALDFVTKTMTAEGLLLPPITEDRDGIGESDPSSENQVLVGKADELVIKWEQDMEKILQYLHRFNQSLVDGRGISILPPKPVAVKRIVAAITSPQSLDFNIEDPKPLTKSLSSSVGLRAPCSIKVCVFHRNKHGERIKFLGMVELQEKVSLLVIIE